MRPRSPGAPMTHLSNRQLRLERIPDPDGDLADWGPFAHTIDGYAAAGGFDACAALAHSGSASTLTELRATLFFVARADRHSGCSADVSPQVRELLRRIRARVAAGELA